LVNWCNHNNCEVCEVNTENAFYQCKNSIDMVGCLPCDTCDDFEERDEDDFNQTIAF
jgi:hypothetical protein